MRFLKICRDWLLDHLIQVQVSLILVQLQKVIAILIWYSQRSHYLTLLRSINESACRDVLKSRLRIEESG